MESMLHITTLHYLVLGAALFLLGVIGVLTRRNVVIVLMSIELILNAVNLNLVVALSAEIRRAAGQKNRGRDTVTQESAP